MKVKNIIAEDFCNYKLPSMFIVSAFCDWKCCLEQGLDISICQNSSLATLSTVDVPDEVIYNTYKNNDITKAIVIGGLEPFLQSIEVCKLIDYFRTRGEECPFVIYTGYTEKEVPMTLDLLKNYSNIIVKFGRYIPNQKEHYDDILGINLASDNQYAIILRR